MRDSRVRFKVKNDAEVVKIRFREGKGGAWSIYFDTYINGKRRKEAVGRELVVEKTPYDRKQNDDVMTAVRAMRAERIKALAQGEDILSHSTRDKETFYDYITKHRDIFGARFEFLLSVCKDEKDILISTITAKDIEKIVGNITEDHYKNSVVNLINDIRMVCKHAVKEGRLKAYPIVNTKELKARFKDAKEMTFLTKDELKMMEDIREYLPKGQKRILTLFLFSCYTGLRKSDVRDLKREHIFYEDGKPAFIKKRQVKTRRDVIVPLNNKALELMPDLTELKPSDSLFDFGSEYICAANIIEIIRKKAGIDRQINFHTSRHTFATLSLTLGGDVYTVSKLLGHTSVKTTEIYAKVVDEKKKQVISLFDNL